MADVHEPVTEQPEDFNLREQIARIDRAQAETRKFVEEASKLKVERYVTPVAALAAIVSGAFTALAAAFIAHHWH